MNEAESKVDSRVSRVSGHSARRSRPALRVALALSFIALVGLNLPDRSGPQGRPVVAQAPGGIVNLPYVGSSDARGVDIEIKRHGGELWGVAGARGYLYLGQGAEVSRYRLDEGSRPRRELMLRTGYVPRTMYVWEEQVLVVGQAEATLVSVAGTGPPRVLWSRGEAEGQSAEMLELLSEDRNCRSGSFDLVLCLQHLPGLQSYRADEGGLHALAPLALAGPFDEGGRRIAWTGDGRAVVTLGFNDGAGRGIGLHIVDLRDPAGPTSQAVIKEEGAVAHDPVRIRDRWLFASEHRDSRFPDSWNGLVVYELEDDGRARRAFEIHLSPASIESMEISGDRLIAFAESGDRPRMVGEILVFDIADPERPRLMGRAPACDQASSDGIVAGVVGNRAAVACVTGRADGNFLEIFELRDGNPTSVGRSWLDTVEPLMLEDDFEAHHSYEVQAIGRDGMAFLSTPSGSALVDIGGEPAARLPFFELGIEPFDVVTTGGGRIAVDRRTGTDIEWRLASWSIATGLDLFDRAALAAGRPIGSIVRGSGWTRPIGIGDAVGIEGQEFLNLFDLDETGVMAQVGIARPHGFNKAITYAREHEGLLWIARGGPRFIDVLDVRDPRLPRYFEPIPLPEEIAQADRLALGHGRVYVSDFGAGIGVIDVADVEAPRSLAFWPDRRGEIFVHGRHLIVADGDAVEVIDPSDAAAPRTLSWARFPEDPGAIDPDEGVFECTGQAVSYALAGDVLFRLHCTQRPGSTIHDGRGRLDAIDLSVPERPVTLPSIGLGHNGQLASDGETAWAATREGGLIEIGVRRWGRAAVSGALSIGDFNDRRTGTGGR